MDWVAFHSSPRFLCRVNRAMRSALETSNVVGMGMSEHDGLGRPEPTEPVRPAVDENAFFDQQAAVPAMRPVLDVDLAACPRKPKFHSVFTHFTTELVRHPVF